MYEYLKKRPEREREGGEESERERQHNAISINMQPFVYLSLEILPVEKQVKVTIAQNKTRT